MEGVGKCMYLLPGLVRLDLGDGGGLGGNGEEVAGVVSSMPSLPINPNPILTPPVQYGKGLHDTADLFFTF